MCGLASQMDSTKHNKPCSSKCVFLCHSHHIATATIHCHLYGTPDRTVSVEKERGGVRWGGGGGVN